VIELRPTDTTVPTPTLFPEKIPDPTLISPVFAIPVITDEPTATTLPTKNVLVVPMPVTVVLAAIDGPRIIEETKIFSVLAAATPVLLKIQ